MIFFAQYIEYDSHNKEYWCSEYDIEHVNVSSLARSFDTCYFFGSSLQRGLHLALYLAPQAPEPFCTFHLK